MQHLAADARCCIAPRCLCVLDLSGSCGQGRSNIAALRNLGVLKRAMGRGDEAAALVEEAAALSDVHSAHRGAPAAGAAVSARQQLSLSFPSEAGPPDMSGI